MQPYPDHGMPQSGNYELVHRDSYLLHETCEPVDMALDEYEREQLIGAMMRIIIDKGGVGLAAPQLGVLQRIILIRTKKTRAIMINPKILRSYGGSIMDWERCLSFPALNGERMPERLIRRQKRVVVEFTDPMGLAHTKTFSNMDARVIQHEIDHLNGETIL